MKFIYFIGMDFGKETFDASIMTEEKQELDNKTFANSEEGFNALIKLVVSYKIPLKDALFCAENMGVEVAGIARFSLKKKLNLALACPIDIKKTGGMQRGKTDKQDALRIAQYALIKQANLRLYEKPSSVILSLRDCLNIRNSYIKTRVRLSQELKALRVDGDRQALQQLEESLNNFIKSCEAEVKLIEQEINRLLKLYEEIYQNYLLLKSITGISLINIVTMICHTENFTKFESARQYACYGGVAPFEYSSGISVRGRTRVSHYANKQVKQLLTRAALAAIVHDPELRAYYKRKKAEGKHSNVVINAVRFKLIQRCFAVVKRKTPYVFAFNLEFILNQRSPSRQGEILFSDNL